jgi:hypothetical protein
MTRRSAFRNVPGSSADELQIETRKRTAKKWIGGVLAGCVVLAGCAAGPRSTAQPTPQINATQPCEDSDVKQPFMFREAKLPQDFPPPGPVGQVVIKDYPRYRLARFRAAESSRSGSPDDMFMPLFNHIKRNDIAMTAPVEIEYAASSEPNDTGAGRRGQQHATSMAFMYAVPSLGIAGPDPADKRVVVEDIPAMTVLSIGVRGGYTEKNFAAALAKLDDWLAASRERFRVTGPPRYLAYNSPFVPWFLKFGEVQLRVERIE